MKQKRTIRGEDVERALKSSKTNKAAWSGNIPTELHKYGGKNVVIFLMNMFNEILAGQDVQQEWNSPYICSIYIMKQY
jgi:hypothetical protein